MYRRAQIVLAASVMVAALDGGCHGSAGNPGYSVTIGPAGGTLSAAGSSLDIPAAALAASTTIVMTSVAQNMLPGGGVTGGSAYELAPEGQAFTTPVTITLQFDPAELPAMTQGSDLAIFTTSTGTTDHAYWLGTRLVDSTHLSAQITHFSWIWIGDPRPFTSQTAGPTTSCGIGGAACLNFDLDEEGFCALCQCNDGSECPGGDPSQCCACPDGTACPRNSPSLCSQCDAGALTPIVPGTPSESVGPNCTLDSALCSVCPLDTPVACAKGICCPADHRVCCADGQSCGVNTEACPQADENAGANPSADGDANGLADANASTDGGTE